MNFIDLKKQYNLIEKNINSSIMDVLKNGNYILGKENTILEKKLSNFVDSKYCLTCSSGTDALLMCLMAWNIGPGDAVLTTTFSYIATSEVIRLVGATPIFIDIDRKTFNINPNGITKAVLKAKKMDLSPKVLIPVNIFGLCANYQDINKMAKKYNLLVLEDAAQSFGASSYNQKSGTFGDASATSFFPAKPLGCYGDGGAVFTNNEQLVEKLLSIRVHGMGKDKYDNIRTGLNARLDTIQAAILIEKLKIFPNEIILRNKIARLYNKKLNDHFVSQKIDKNNLSVFAQYSILAKNSKHRLKILKKMKKNNIPIMIYYQKPLHMQTVNKDLKYNQGDLPVSEFISECIFSLPMHPYLEEDDINLITDILLDMK